jgi:hypothetical protein
MKSWPEKAVFETDLAPKKLGFAIFKFFLSLAGTQTLDTWCMMEVVQLRQTMLCWPWGSDKP